MTKPTIPEVLPLVKAYVRKPGNEVGGSLHIILDDHNIDDKSCWFCYGFAAGKDDKDGIKIAELLTRMSKTQRLKIAQECWHD